MNPNTGAIATFENAADAKEAGFGVPLTKAEAEQLLRTPREERLHVMGLRRGMPPPDMTPRTTPKPTPRRFKTRVRKSR